jgi:hypothetical protein
MGTERLTARAVLACALAAVAGVAGVGGVGGVGGCARSSVEGSLASPVLAGDVNAELDFWDALGERLLISNDEALHGLFLFADGQDPRRTYQERLDEARRRAWVASDFDEPGNLAMQRGAVARAICVQCKVEGGVMMRVAGPVPRYATRELQYLGLMGNGSEQQAISGREFMGMISKAQDYINTQAALARAATEIPPTATGAPGSPASAPPVPTPGAGAKD